MQSAAAYAISGALAAPLLGRLVDRCGQTTVLTSGAVLTALVLVATGMLPSDTSRVLLVALAAATGLATPPLAACIRTVLPEIAADPSRLSALFAFGSRFAGNSLPSQGWRRTTDHHQHGGPAGPKR